MCYVMVVWFWGLSSGVFMEKVDFADQEKCESAAQAVNDNGPLGSKAMCFPVCR